MSHLSRFIALAILLIPTHHVLADVSASVALDWSSLNIQALSLPGGSTAPTFEWLSEYGYFETTARTAGGAPTSDIQSVSDFNSPLFIQSVTSLAESSADRSDSLIQLEAFGKTGTNPWGIDTNDASVWGENYGSFEMSGSGMVLISIDWQIDLIGTLNDPDEVAGAGAYIYAGFSDSQNQSGYAGSDVDFNTFDDGAGSRNGTLSIVIVNIGNGILSGDLYFGGSADASAVSVPEPSTLAMLTIGLGVVGLVTWRRRKA